MRRRPAGFRVAARAERPGVLAVAGRRRFTAAVPRARTGLVRPGGVSVPEACDPAAGATVDRFERLRGDAGARSAPRVRAAGADLRRVRGDLRAMDRQRIEPLRA